MSDDNDTSKTHYICQTYVAPAGRTSAQQGVEIGQQFEYSTAAEAQGRAEREFQSDGCVGADAYMLVEDTGSGEVSAPTFLVRIGDVPEFDGA